MQQNKNVKKNKSRLVNLITIGALLILAAGLIIAWQAGLFQSPHADLDRDEIHSMLDSLNTPDPGSASASPGVEATPVPDSPTAEKPNEPVQEPEAYLFIILNNRVWGIEPLGEERDVTVDQGSGVVNVIHLLPDGFYMHSSTCDNQLCISEGTVTVGNYQQRFLGPCVYCLPHNLQLELVVPGATPDPNAPDI